MNEAPQVLGSAFPENHWSTASPAFEFASKKRLQLMDHLSIRGMLVSEENSLL